VFRLWEILHFGWTPHVPQVTLWQIATILDGRVVRHIFSHNMIKVGAFVETSFNPRPPLSNPKATCATRDFLLMTIRPKVNNHVADVLDIIAVPQEV
jgi:hypothetical protein